MTLSSTLDRIKAFFVFIIFLLLLIFILQNAVQVTISFLVWDFTLPRITLVLILFAAGLLTGLLISGLRKLKSD